MMLVAVTTIQNTTDKISYYKDLEGGSEAYLAAQSAAEDGVLAMKNYNAGYTNSAAVDSFSTDYDGDGTDETTSQYQVYGNAQANSNDTSVPFYLPMPGTGSAGTDCSVTDSNHDGDFDNDPAVNDPCSWNKMLYGDSVTIPLYTDDGLGGLFFPTDLGFTSWSLKMRTPCADPTDDPSTCASSGRSEFKTSDSTTGEGDSVILWQLTGTDTSGNAISLVPDDGTGRDMFFVDDRAGWTYNNEIYESLFNDHLASDFTVLKADSTSTNYSSLYDFCTRTDLASLNLQMNIVTPLKDTSDNSIPYLEWQLTENSTSPMADSKSVIVGEGYHQGTDHIFYYPYTVTRSTTGESSNVYTLSN